LIDPKRLELPSYTEIPHLYDPGHAPIEAQVITSSKQAAKALSRLVKVMEYRYDQFAKANVRNIDSYNQKRKDAGLPPEYYLVVIIDELADLMLTSPKEVEDSVQRLAQMARAVGIHLVLATQRRRWMSSQASSRRTCRRALRFAWRRPLIRVLLWIRVVLNSYGKRRYALSSAASPEPFRVQGAYVRRPKLKTW